MSTLNSLVIVTVTDYTTVYFTPTSTFKILSSSLPTSSTAMHTTTNISSAMNTIPTSTPYLSTATLPTSSSPPLPLTSEPKTFDDTLIKLTLASLVLMALILLSLVAYAIYLRCRGRCPQCNNKPTSKGKWEPGQVKSVTKEMVKQREKMNSEHLKSGSSTPWPKANPMEVDLERGVVDDEEHAKQAARAEALACLERREWDDASQRTTVGDRFFTFAEIETQPGPDLRVPSPTYRTREISLAASSVYSRPGGSFVGQRLEERHSLPASSPSKYPSYTNREWANPFVDTATESVVQRANTVNIKGKRAVNDSNDASPPHIGAARRRSQAYGGLPLPPGFENVTL